MTWHFVGMETFDQKLSRYCGATLSEGNGLGTYDKLGADNGGGTGFGYGYRNGCGEGDGGGGAGGSKTENENWFTIRTGDGRSPK